MSEQDYEFISALPKRFRLQIFNDYFIYSFTNFINGDISGLMSVLIIEMLKIVEVAEDQYIKLARAFVNRTLLLV